MIYIRTNLILIFPLLFSSLFSSEVVTYIEDSFHNPCVCSILDYNDDGELIQETLVGNLSGNCVVPLVIGEDGFPVQNGIESCSVNYQSDSWWNRLSKLFYWCLGYVEDKTNQSIHIFSSELGLATHFQEEMVDFARAYFGDAFFRLMGYDCEDNEETGHYGNGEVNDKIRITFINGILTTKNMLLENLELISGTHGGVNIHYVLQATEGWSTDMAKMLGIKFGFYAGLTSIYTDMLAQTWRKMIEEMGGVGNGGKILHYAHSLGGTVTDRAKYLLTPEERKMITVVTLGSATLIRNEEFESVVNYISVHDGVGNNGVIIDPLGHIRNLFDEASNVVFIGDFFSLPPWPMDHLLISETYSNKLKQLGEKFKAEYLMRDAN